MVRRNELACRNGWSEDLWTAGSEDGSDRGSISVEHHASRPVAPASVDEIAAVALLTVDADSSPTMPEDVVVGQTPVMRSTHDEEADERSMLLGQDTRSAIKRARERHRAKTAPRTRPMELAESGDHGQQEPDGDHLVADPTRVETTPPSSEAAGTSGPESTKVPQGAPGDAGLTVSAPSQRHDMTLPFNLARAATPIAVEDPFDTVPARRQDVELPRAWQVPQRPLLRTPEDPVNRPQPESSEAIQVVEPPRIPTRPVPMRAAASRVSRFRDDTDYLPGVSVTEQDIVPEPPASSFDLALDRARQARDAATGMAPRRGGEDQVEASADVSESVRSGNQEGHTSQDVQMAKIGIAGLDDIDDDELDMTVQIAPEVQRGCRTCRDFRPAEGGGRGWCNNKFAFSHRRMVTGEGVPCQTSLGCWWLPHDDVWLAKADIAAHSQPTPIFDAWQAEAAAREAPVFPPVRRRRRS